jgi:hypothetical protein
MPQYSSSTISRRRFLGTMSASALGGLLLRGDSPATAAPRLGPASLIRCAVVRRPPPYWLGSPGTACDLDGDRKRYEAAFAQTAGPLGVEVLPEPEVLQAEDAVVDFASRLEADPPDAILINLQHLGAWNWADRIAATRLPTIIFAPLGAAAIRHLERISRRPSVHIVSSLDPSAVHQAFALLHPPVTCPSQSTIPPDHLPAGR